MHQEMNKKTTEIIEMIDRTINELVYEKTSLIKAYNYYHGKRDPEQFRHLEENYGIGTPSSIEFIPLVKKHVDVLIGEYLSTPLNPRISCKDKKTISNIHRDKQLKIQQEVIKELRSHLNNSIYAALEGKPQAVDKSIESQIKSLIEEIDKNFISEYEIAGQNIVDHSMQSRQIDFLNKRKTFITDLLISGTGYYKVLETQSKESVNLRVLNPINTFIDRNPGSPYLKDSARAVVREYLTKDQILSRYGDILSKEDLEQLEILKDWTSDGSTTTYIRSFDTVTNGTVSDGILGGFEITPLLPFERATSKHFRLFPTYEVEWIKTEKGDNGKYIMNRYEGVRIGTNIYIPIGLSKNIIRSMDTPSDCTLSVNGIFYSDRNGDPFSLILATANLQDKYDIVHFYRDNLLAESGGSGDWVDLAHLPKFLGHDTAERLMKFKAYKKSGVAPFDSSQEGVQVNTAFNGYDDTVKGEAIQALNLVLQNIEETCSSITGVFREKLGGIEQRDAVTNVQVGVKNSSYITKQYYQLMDLMTRDMLIDIINISKIVYKKGISGTLVLGDKLNKIFTSLPEHYTFTDYDLNISDSTDVIQEQTEIKQLTMEFVKGGMVEPDIILEMMTSKSLTRMKEDVSASLNKKRKEADQLGKLSQQVQELDKQLKQTTTEAQKLQKTVEQLNAEKVKLEKDRLSFEKELEWFKAKAESAYNEGKLEFERERVQLEGAQLLDNNQRNDEIRNN